jgi:small ubiquitin-related modifier
MIHHDPDGGLNAAARQRRVETTKIALQARYGKDYDEDIWFFGLGGRIVGRRAADEEEKEAEQEDATRPGPPERATKKPRVKNEPEKIMLQVRDHVGNAVAFKVCRRTPLSRVMGKYAHLQGVCSDSRVFLWQGDRVYGDQTPDSLGFGDNEELDVMRELTGC